jgi:pyruvyltransferase
MLDPGTWVWGAGVNGKHLELAVPDSLKVRAVRGPLTRRYLMDRGTRVPEAFGDPALLIDYSTWIQGGRVAREGGVVCIQNLNDPSPQSIASRARDVSVVASTSPLEEVVARIAGAEVVVGSSLHAVIVAEALGVPARAVRSESESAFKYHDYYEGTGRAGVVIARTIQDAVEMGGVDAPPVIDPALAVAFPRERWSSDMHQH